MSKSATPTRIMTTPSFLGMAVLLGWYPAQAMAQTSYPMITHAVPVAVQRGKETEVTVEGQMDFHGVYKALFEGSGITAAVVPAAMPKAKQSQKAVTRSVKLKLTVAADAALGVREFRLASTLGISSIG